jgi:glycerol-3-phosphate dehydrogenase
VPGETNRFVFALPQPDGLVYVGVTDDEVDGDIPDVPAASQSEIGFLLDTMSQVLARPLTTADVVGTFSGLRPLLQAGGRTADLSRRHAVLVSDGGVVTVVGGKLTTYRRMAQDAVDAAVRQADLPRRPCRTHDLPLVGARQPIGSRTPDRLVRRFGAEAANVVSDAMAVTRLDSSRVTARVSENVTVTLAELVWGVTHEGAATVEDLLDRRTRVGLVAEDRAVVEPAAEQALEYAAEAHR